MRYYLKAACASNIGRYRGNNEDNIYFNGVVLDADSEGTAEPLYQESKLEDPEDFGLFDGMGGHADGQIASYIAANVFKRGHDHDPDDSKRFLEQVMFDMSDAVWKRAEADYSNTGTTASVIRIEDESYYLANVGDSPIFLMRGGQLKQISFSHTDEIYFKNLGGNRKRKPALTQYVGIDPERLLISPYLEEGSICDGDRFLLCSDGLTDMVPPEEIRNILSQQKDIRDIVLDLIDDANAHGGRDNITVILIDISEKRKGHPAKKKAGKTSGKNGSRGRGIILGVLLGVSVLTAVGCTYGLLQTAGDSISSAFGSLPIIGNNNSDSGTSGSGEEETYEDTEEPLVIDEDDLDMGEQ